MRLRTLAMAGACYWLSAAAGAATIDGTWQGEAGSQKIELELHSAGDGAVTGRLRGLSSGADLPLTGHLTGNRVSVSLAPIAFTLDVAFDGDSDLDGTGTRSGAGFEIELERAAPRAPSIRAQDPVAPLPYRSEDITFSGAGGVLAGTITVPEGDGPFAGVVLLTPEGPQDRNGQSFAHRPNLVLADALTRAGFAVLRFDDRGVDKSTGDYGGATTIDFASDASAALAFLKSRADIDPARLALIGRGNGASIAAIAGGDTAALVLISAPSLLGAEALNAATARQMREAGESEDAIAERVALQTKAFAVAADPSKNESDIRNTIKSLIDEAAGLMSFAVPDDVVEQMTRQMAAPWFRHYLSYDPKADYAGLKGRVLAVYGAEDRQNPPADNAATVVAAVGAKAETVTLPGLNGALAPFVADKDASPFDRDVTLDVTALAAIVTWLTGALAKP